MRCKLVTMIYIPSKETEHWKEYFSSRKELKKARDIFWNYFHYKGRMSSSKTNTRIEEKPFTDFYRYLHHEIEIWKID